MNQLNHCLFSTLWQNWTGRGGRAVTKLLMWMVIPLCHQITGEHFVDGDTIVPSDYRWALCGWWYHCAVRLQVSTWRGFLQHSSRDFGSSGLRRCVGQLVSGIFKVSQTLECQEPVPLSQAWHSRRPEPTLKDCLTVNSFKFQLWPEIWGFHSGVYEDVMFQNVAPFVMVLLVPV